MLSVKMRYNNQCAWGGQRAIPTPRPGRAITNWPLNESNLPAKGPAPLLTFAMTLQSNQGAVVRSVPVFLGPETLCHLSIHGVIPRHSGRRLSIFSNVRFTPPMGRQQRDREIGGRMVRMLARLVIRVRIMTRFDRTPI
jgi:hypothetical protein